MVICDPLDRCGNPDKYPAMDHKQVLKVEQLKELLYGIETFKGGDQL